MTSFLQRLFGPKVQPGPVIAVTIETVAIPVEKLTKDMQEVADIFGAIYNGQVFVDPAYADAPKKILVVYDRQGNPCSDIEPLPLRPATRARGGRYAQR